MTAELIEKLPLLIMAAMAILVAANYWATFYILRNLKERHPEVWHHLGSPTVVLNNSIQNSLATFQFIWGRRHRELVDAELSRLIRIARVLHLTGAIILSVGLVGFLGYIFAG